MVNRSSPRFDRSSFEGLSVIEGKCNQALSSESKHDTNCDFRTYKDRSERRWRTSSLAQSHQIRKIIAETVEELSRKGDNNAAHDPEDMLKKVLAQTKESGYSADHIFSILSSSSINETEGIDGDVIERETFITGLKKLSKGIYSWKKCDLEVIADKFDINADGHISLVEFQHYCYHEVPSVAWKAERQRREDKTADEFSVKNVKEIMYGPGKECYVSSKLFWKINVTVEIVLRYCSELDVISIQIYDISNKQDFKTLYVSKSSCAIDETKLQEAVTLARQIKDDKTPEDVEWLFYSNYIMARLQIVKDENEKSGYIARLVRLHCDVDALEIDRPHNMNAPVKKYSDTSKNGKSLEEEFRSKVCSFEKETRSARSSRQTAESFIRSARNSRNTAEGEGSLQSIMRQALDEIATELGESGCS